MSQAGDDTVAAIRKYLDALQPESVEVLDDSGAHIGHPGAREGGHYQVIVVAKAFAGRNRPSRHRMVYSALSPLIPSRIHALSIKALSPDEF
jgi:BolA protein